MDPVLGDVRHEDRQQSVFREEWLLDIVYFLSTHLPIQVTSFLILLPATELTRWLGIPSLVNAVGHIERWGDGFRLEYLE